MLSAARQHPKSVAIAVVFMALVTAVLGIAMVASSPSGADNAKAHAAKVRAEEEHDAQRTINAARLESFFMIDKAYRMPADDGYCLAYSFVNRSYTITGSARAMIVFNEQSDGTRRTDWFSSTDPDFNDTPEDRRSYVNKWKEMCGSSQDHQGNATPLT